MSYDFDGSPDHSAPVYDHVVRYSPRDLELLVTLLEIAAIMLTPTTGAVFTTEQLFVEAQRLNGEQTLHEMDLRIVLGGMGYALKREGDRSWSMK